MEKHEVLNVLEKIIDEVKTAVLATVDKDGNAHMRWVTPAIIQGRKGAIYTVTSPRAAKVKQVKSNPNVQWLFQTPALDKIVTIEGKVNVVDNPSIRSEVLEIVGPRLRPFWKINMDERDLLVLETIIEKAVFYIPMKGKKEVVRF